MRKPITEAHAREVHGRALTRSEQMARIKGANTKPEMALRRALWSRGMRYRIHARTLASKPDVFFPAKRVAVFVDGCFWHGCPLHYARPRTREEFWSAKLVTNLERDARTSAMLAEAGWSVLRLWEHEVVEDLDGATDRVEQIVRRKAAPTWPSQLRVRRIVEIADRVERREFVLLGAPTDVIEALEGPRVTAKARAKKR